MNGVTPHETTVIDRKPIITCAGELEVFAGIEDALTAALPEDTCEFRRSLGRSIRDVHIGANFAPFSPKGLPKNTQWDLIRQPLFHIYWTECSDVDLYKVNVKEDIDDWLKELTNKDIPDWLIVVVENFDGKRANKLLPRTTVLDKIRSDFATKHGDRCISVINPGKVEVRTADSWRGLVVRIRQLVLISYAKAIAKLEDHVRQQREKRNEHGWQFMEYFKLQEELAQVLEMLGLYDEALVQYDELDALFSQFVVNGPVGENVNWLKDFQMPLQRWHSLKLGPCVLPDDPSLLELRAYLYAKQAHMLLLGNKIWEVASRCLPFLHSCTRELVILEITAPQGAVACWLFLACMEVLHACEKHNQAEQIEAYSTHTASLWAYASQKLRFLGELCGLMPGDSPSSDQLHMVVYLSAGMGDNPGRPACPSPTDKLKQALCSQNSFNKTYLELAELAMGTYKHIGRRRLARIIGKEVASFYLLLGELQKSAAFLNDALKQFEEDNWRELAAQTQIELAECYKKCNDIRKFVRACAATAAAPEMDNLIRWSYHDEMIKALNGSQIDRTLIVPFKEMIKIVSVCVQTGLVDEPVMQDNEIVIELTLFSNFPKELLCDSVKISIETEFHDKKEKKGRRSSNVLTSKDLKQQDTSLQRLNIQRHLDYQQDKTLSSASVVCGKTPLKRADSTAAPIYHSEFNDYLEIAKTKLSPGLNIMRLRKTADKVGKYYLGQVAIHVKLMELISISLTPKLFFEVCRVEPTVKLEDQSALLSGIEQTMQLIVTIGSYKVAENCTIKMAASLGLTLQYGGDENEFVTSIEVPLTHSEPFTTSSTAIRVLADTPSKEHQVTISCPWSTRAIPLVFDFSSPMSATWRLFTVQHRKFIQITLTSQCERAFTVVGDELLFNNNVNVTGFNDFSSQEVTNGLSLVFTYEMLHSGNLTNEEFDATRGIFNLRYKLSGGGDEKTRLYSYNFKLTNYQTLFQVHARVEPTKGSEFCRVGAVCHLQLQVRPAGRQLQANCGSLMYEVLAEQSMWAVCGRTAGVISFDADSDAQTVVLDVMPLNSGYLPLPLIRLSKYIPADFDKSDQHPRLIRFNAGQVYNASKGQQVHVISAGVDG
ncbi:trafficking protein particle complex subunit 10 isoform X2 [Atheta coriaria]|uniref:trafficking protein particle complex subunit 10 isoform X2 n=1 Tax=Dalotia coriaria TaxID=877792 RepID=UPI0031F42CBB